jgi:hypothetical protein
VPLPQLHLAPLRRYSSMSLQYSRGCPFTCEFCDIIEGYRRILRTIYNPREYFERASASLSQLGAAAKTPVVFSDLMAVARSLWRQGFLADYRMEYWKFIGQTLHRHRQHLHQAFTLAIMGHHFFKLVDAAESS